MTTDGQNMNNLESFYDSDTHEIVLIQYARFASSLKFVGPSTNFDSSGGHI